MSTPSIKQLVDAVDASQDGRPLHGFMEGDDVRWERFNEAEFMSVGDVLNLLLIKIAVSEHRAVDVNYVIHQLKLSRSIFEHAGNADDEAADQIRADIAYAKAIGCDL